MAATNHPVDGDVRVVSKKLVTRAVRGAIFRSYKVEADVRRRGRWVPLSLTADAFGEAEIPDGVTDEVERANLLHAVRHYRRGAKPNGARLKRTKRACSARGRRLRASGDAKAASRLARYCPPPGRRKKNATPDVSLYRVRAAMGRRGALEVPLYVRRPDGSKDVIVRVSAAGALSLPPSLTAAERAAALRVAAAGVAARRRKEAAMARTRQKTMAEIRRADPEHFRDARPFGGGYPGTKFFGPYTGPNGTYFVQEWPTRGTSLEEYGPLFWEEYKFGPRGVMRMESNGYNSRAEAVWSARESAIGD